MFKVGDKVRCINADGRTKLTEGEVYTVRQLNVFGNEMSLKEIRIGSFYPDRFVLEFMSQTDILGDYHV